MKVNKIVTIQSNYITQEDAKKVHQFIWDKKAKVFREGNVYLVKKDIYYKGINDTGNFPSDANLIVLYNGRTKQEMDRKTSVHQLKAVDRVRELQRMLYRMFLFHTAVKQMKNKETRRALAEFIYDIKQKDRKSTRLNSSHVAISYAVVCLKKKRRGPAERHLAA